ncbi:IS982 family transposase [Patescibacteria group bacterium]|nr:IS982 family transposase [Patescibacteria group bacterium]MBU4056738.1 IS982 family transposase [Patescibacteria group bacterium]
MTLLQNIDDLNLILITIYYFTDNFLKGMLGNIKYALTQPNQNQPPIKKHNLSLAELTSLAIFRFFTGHGNWKDFYRHIKTYHRQDFLNLPNYQNFLEAINKLSVLASIMLQGFMNIFNKISGENGLKFADSTKLKVCEIKREFSHKVCFGLASKSKSSMGWFYGFRLHIICNELMQILKLKITTGTGDERKTLEIMWNDIFGMIIADAGYVSRKLEKKALSSGKFFLTGVRANMRKIMTETQHQFLRLRQLVETVFSVLKLRMGLETSLPRSPLGYFAHYIWCLTAYQFKKFLELLFVKPLLA